MAWLSLGAIIFGLVCTVYGLNSFATNNWFVGFIYLLVAWVPLVYSVWYVWDKAGKRKALHQRLAKEIGVNIGSGFDHSEDGSGVIIDTKGKRVAIHVDGQFKTYSYDDVRDVEIVKEQFKRTGVLAPDVANAAAARRNTGLFITVRDVENPRWRIVMREERIQQRWLELCNQELREGGSAPRRSDMSAVPGAAGRAIRFE